MESCPPTIDFSMLKDLTFCLMSRSSTQREIIDPLFAASNIQPHIFLETKSNRTNVAMVQNNLCCSIVPYYYAKNNGKIACFRLSCHPTWNLVVCHRRSRYLPAAAKEFVQLAALYFEREAKDINRML
ncbi:MAG: LysR family transcriptional regulator substrate-binding protein [Oscillospiraceae bacterium]